MLHSVVGGAQGVKRASPVHAMQYFRDVLKQRHAIGLGDHLLDHLRWERPVACDTRNHPLHLARNYKRETIEIIEQFLDAEEVEVVRLTPRLFERAFALYTAHRIKHGGWWTACRSLSCETQV